MNLTTMLEDYWGGYTPPLGAANAVSSDPPPDDIVTRLRQAIEEETGQALEPKPRPRIGFLP